MTIFVSGYAIEVYAIAYGDQNKQQTIKRS